MNESKRHTIIEELKSLTVYVTYILYVIHTHWLERAASVALTGHSDENWKLCSLWKSCDFHVQVNVKSAFT